MFPWLLWIFAMSLKFWTIVRGWLRIGKWPLKWECVHGHGLMYRGRSRPSAEKMHLMNRAMGMASEEGKSLCRCLGRYSVLFTVNMIMDWPKTRHRVKSAECLLVEYKSVPFRAATNGGELFCSDFVTLPERKWIARGRRIYVRIADFILCAPSSSLQKLQPDTLGRN